MAKIPTYSPRWLSAFYDFIGSLPIPGWVLVTAAILVIGISMHLAAWTQGALPWGELTSYLALRGGFIALVPAMWRLLDRHAQRAIQEYVEALGKSKKEYEKLLTEFLSLPAAGAVLILVLGGVNGYFEGSTEATQLIPISAQVWPWMSLTSWIVGNAFYALIAYRTILQIGRMNKLFDQLPLNLFSPGPVYILSRYGANFAATVLFFGHSLALLSLPQYYFSPHGVFFMGLLTLQGLLIFFAPLTQINRRMRRAKDGLLNRLGRDQQQLNERLHKAVGGKSLGAVAELRTAIGALKEQREVLVKLPTWPWQPDSLRNLFTPMLIPVLVYLAQRLLSAFFGI